MPPTPHNRIDTLFRSRRNILSVYLTAGFPTLHDTVPLCATLQESGVDMIEIGFPFSDPLADGPVIQQSSERALRNGMTVATLFTQLRELRASVSIPVLLMGYVNPVIQYGVERFFADAAAVGVDGLIIPDLPHHVFHTTYRSSCHAHGLHFIPLITQATSPERLRAIDSAATGFIYAVSSHAVTGGALTVDTARTTYFERLAQSALTHPVMLGFGISDKTSFLAACAHVHGAIVGSAYIRALGTAQDIHLTTRCNITPFTL